MTPRPAAPLCPRASLSPRGATPRLAALLLLAACSRPASGRKPPPAPPSAASPAPPSAAPPPSPLAPAPLPPPREAPLLGDGEPAPAHAALLWVRPRDAAPGLSEQSIFVDDDGQPLARRPGAWLHERRVSVEARSSPAAPCPRGNTPFPSRLRHRTALLAPPGPPLVLIEPAPPDEALAEETHRPLAALGDTLFFQVDRVEGPCDELPRYRASFVALRVEGQRVEKRETAALVRDPGGRAEAAEAMRRRRLEGAPPVAERDLILTMVLPSFAPSPRWLAQYTAPCPWELSYGGWGSGTRSERAEAAPLDGTPEAALRYARRAGALEVVGVIAPPGKPAR